MDDFVSKITTFLLCRHEIWCKNVWHSFEEWYTSSASDSARKAFAEQFSLWIQTSEDVEMGVYEYEFIMELFNDKDVLLKITSALVSSAALVQCTHATPAGQIPQYDEFLQMYPIPYAAHPPDTSSSSSSLSSLTLPALSDSLPHGIISLPAARLSLLSPHIFAPPEDPNTPPTHARFPVSSDAWYCSLETVLAGMALSLQHAHLTHCTTDTHSLGQAVVQAFRAAKLAGRSLATPREEYAWAAYLHAQQRATNKMHAAHSDAISGHGACIGVNVDGTLGEACSAKVYADAIAAASPSTLVEALWAQGVSACVHRDLVELSGEGQAAEQVERKDNQKQEAERDGSVGVEHRARSCLQRKLAAARAHVGALQRAVSAALLHSDKSPPSSATDDVDAAECVAAARRSARGMGEVRAVWRACAVLLWAAGGDDDNTPHTCGDHDENSVAIGAGAVEDEGVGSALNTHTATVATATGKGVHTAAPEEIVEKRVGEDRVAAETTVLRVPEQGNAQDDAVSGARIAGSVGDIDGVEGADGGAAGGLHGNGANGAGTGEAPRVDHTRGVSDSAMLASVREELWRLRVRGAATALSLLHAATGLGGRRHAGVGTGMSLGTNTGMGTSMGGGKGVCLAERERVLLYVPGCVWNIVNGICAAADDESGDAPGIGGGSADDRGRVSATPNALTTHPTHSRTLPPSSPSPAPACPSLARVVRAWRGMARSNALEAARDLQRVAAVLREGVEREAAMCMQRIDVDVGEGEPEDREEGEDMQVQERAVRED